MPIKKTLIIIGLLIAWILTIKIAESEILIDNATYSKQFIVQSGAVLSLRDMVLHMVEDAGYSPKLANQIINCESGWKTTAKNYNKNGTWDVGIWQINDVHGLSWEDREDPIKSTEYAIKLLQSNRSWEHWVCLGLI